ncbi:MAG: YCF48-related protein [Phycisphaerales bacterium]|nr:YCF48-related protein [Phycisphaerales bacterium]
MTNIHNALISILLIVLLCSCSKITDNSANTISKILGIGVAVGDGGTIFRTVDFGNTWQQGTIVPATNLTSVTSVPNTNRFVATGYSESIFISDDSGRLWKEIRKKTNARTFNDVSFLDENIGVAVGDSAIFRTTDGGNTWNEIEVNNLKVVLLSIIPLYPNSFLTVGYEGNVFKSNDGGLTWNNVTPNIVNINTFTFNRSILVPNTKTVLVGARDDIGNGFIFTSSDAAQTSNNWQQINSLPNPIDNIVAFATTTDGIKTEIWAMGTSLFSSFNGGANWTETPIDNFARFDLENISIVNDTLAYITGSDNFDDLGMLLKLKAPNFTSYQEIKTNNANTLRGIAWK